MNGDLLKIYNEIHKVDLKVTEMQVKQKENHTENRNDIGVLFKKHDFHEARSDGFRNDVVKLKAHQTIHWFLLSGIILSILWFKFM